MVPVPNESLLDHRTQVRLRGLFPRSLIGGGRRRKELSSLCGSKFVWEQVLAELIRQELASCLGPKLLKFFRPAQMAPSVMIDGRWMAGWMDALVLERFFCLDDIDLHGTS